MVQSSPQDSTPSVNMGILEQFVGLYLRSAYESVYGDFSAHVGEDTLKPKYFTILTLVVYNPNISQTRIGQAANLDKSTIAKALRWLEDHELITRTRPNHDRRTHLTIATETGRALQQRMEEKGQRHLHKLRETLGETRYDDLIETLQIIVKTLSTSDQ